MEYIFIHTNGTDSVIRLLDILKSLGINISTGNLDRNHIGANFAAKKAQWWHLPGVLMLQFSREVNQTTAEDVYAHFLNKIPKDIKTYKQYNSKLQEIK